MDLRSNRRRRLENELKEFGVYEKFDNVEEMKQLLDGYRGSLMYDDGVVIEDELEQALRASEQNFQGHSEDIVNSTMISCLTPDVRMRSWESCSPEIATEKITVRATVHHPMNWSPPKSPNNDEDKENELEGGRKRVGSVNEAMGIEHTVKPCLNSQQPTDISESDSGVHISDIINESGDDSNAISYA